MTFVPREAGGEFGWYRPCVSILWALWAKQFVAGVLRRHVILHAQLSPKLILVLEKHMSVSTQLLEISGKHWGWIVWPTITTGLLVFLYGPVLRGARALQWSTDPDYGHGFLVPVFSAYILWRRRSCLLGAETKPANFRFSGHDRCDLPRYVGLTRELNCSLVGSLLLVLLSGMTMFLVGWNALRLVSFSAGFSHFCDSHPGHHLQPDYFSDAIACVAFSQFLAGICSRTGVA